MRYSDKKARRKQARREREGHRDRLGRARYQALVKDLVAVIRLAFEAGATGSLLGLEGPLRHAIRSDLCLQGWRWQDADRMAREILIDAFHAVHAKRPSWNEGQREWTIPANTLIERTRCVHCHKPLPEGHHKFCGHICAVAAGKRRERIDRLTDETAIDMVNAYWT